MDTGNPSYSNMAAKRPARPQPAKRLVNATEQVDPKIKAFKDAVKSAENSTLVFNLNMGNVKILNKKTILSKATLALTAKAAKLEGNPEHKPSQDTVDALDDVLSIAKRVELYGKSTKPFRNVRMKDDPRNGTFCTVPVKYEFSNKDARIAAESVLRERCKAECTTPYPLIVRHCINKVISHMQPHFQGEFIKVTVDAAKFGMKVSRKSATGWINYGKLIPFPEEAYNVTARVVPDDLELTDLPDCGPTGEAAGAGTD